MHNFRKGEESASFQKLFEMFSDHPGLDQESNSRLESNSSVAIGRGSCNKLAALEVIAWIETGRATREKEFQTAKLYLS